MKLKKKLTPFQMTIDEDGQSFQDNKVVDIHLCHKR